MLVLLASVSASAARNVETSTVSAAEHHVHQAEAPADEQRAAEQRLDLLGARVGGDVEVLGRDAEQQVAHRAADHVGGVARVAQHVAHLERAVADGVARDAVLGSRGTRCGPGASQAEHAADEAFDHCGARILAQGNHRPAAARGLGGQLRVRVHRDRPA